MSWLLRWSERQYVFAFVFVFILTVGLFIFGNEAYFQATKINRLDWKRQTDTFVLKLFEQYQTPQMAMNAFSQAKEGLYILDSLHWVVDQNAKIIASDTSAPLPHLQHPSIQALDKTVNQINWPESPGEFVYFITYENNARELVGIGRFYKSANYLVTAQKTRNTTLSRLLAHYNSWSIVMFVACALIFVILSMAFLYTRAQREGARLLLLKEIGHDLGSPLASLKSLVENLQDSSEKLDASLKAQVLQHCHSQINYIQELVDNVLFIVELRSHKYHKSLQQFSLQNLIEEELDIAKGMQGQAASLQYNLKVNTSSYQDSEIFGDPLLMRRAIKNILVNAQKHAKSIIDVQLFQNEGRLVLEVENDGEGFSDSLLAKWRKRWIGSRFKESSDWELGGLGLIIVLQIARMHDGNLEVFNRSRGHSGQVDASAVVRLCFNLRQ